MGWLELLVLGGLCWFGRRWRSPLATPLTGFPRSP
jgi:hypothetical protein